MRKQDFDNGYLFLMLGSDVALSVHYDLALQGRAVISARLAAEIPKEIIAALVIASVVDMVHPGVKVKLLTCIRILEEQAKSEPDDDPPF